MGRENLKMRIGKIAAYLEKSYQPPEEKPFVKVAELVVILPALGFFYIWEFFNRCQMPYFLYFEVKDALAVLYENLMPIIYIATLLSLMLALITPLILKKKPRPLDNEVNSQDPAVRESALEGRISMFTMIVTFLTVLAGLYVLLSAYNFEWKILTILLLFGGAVGYIYLFESRNLGFGLIILLAFLYAEVKGNADARQRMLNKPKIEITLKGYSDKPVLDEGEDCRYFLYKTSNYYFIKDSCKRRIEVYSTSGQEVNRFNID
ncbi:hypothetical protein [Chryseobacterium joostei]|uniref:hypothetical protein n=1 Tax=Chryseobacterium joostei TaxID=112234 RepID=UPI003D0EC8D7